MGLLGCEIDQSDFDVNDNWIQVYHHANNAYRINPVAFTSTESGYLIVNGTSADPTAQKNTLQVIETDLAGNILRVDSFPEIYNPTGKIFPANNGLSIVSTNNVGAGKITTLLTGDGDDIGFVQNPISSYTDSTGKLLVMDFNITGTSTAGIPTGESKIYDTEGNTWLSTEISNTLNITGPNQLDPRGEFQFFIGQARLENQEVYYANIFSGNTLRLLFFNQNQTLGFIYDFQSNAGVKAILQKPDGNFILITFTGNELFLHTNYQFQPNDFGQRIDNSMASLYPMTIGYQSSIISGKASLNGKYYGLFIGGTVSNEIGILKCSLDEEVKQQLYYFPFDNDVEVIDFMQDDHENLIVLARLMVDNSPRPLLIKIPKRKLE